MDNVYLIIMIILAALAISGLVVGVSNDATNFLNSAIGSKAAPRYVITLIASIGILIGVLTSSGMMEVARSGVFHPGMFTFTEVMMLFLAVMFTNVLLLDLFNTLGLPTSTTVSLVLGLLGAAVGVAVYKINHTSTANMSDLALYINSGKAMAIISGILISVVIAFISGMIIMYLTRLIFSFRYHKKMVHLGALWCGFALTCITYFAIFKGLKGSIILPPGAMFWMEHHTFALLCILFIGWSAFMSLLSLLKINILRITVLAGTLSLALAFAGNDLVNFIGVFMASFDSYHIASITGNTSMLMGDLTKPVIAHTGILLLSGGIMVLTLWFSKKARTVTDTEVNLARQDAGVERFGSTSLSRTLVRSSLNFSKKFDRFIPEKAQRFIESRFVPTSAVRNASEQAPFDLIRATVNLTVASLLISLATSLTLPLSTTYVTFMVAMGSSLADRAWGRESAVYRITGVLTVISGWFLTALIAFTIAFVLAALLMWGESISIVALTIVCTLLLIQSTVSHSRKQKKTAAKVAKAKDSHESTIMSQCLDEVSATMEKVTLVYNQTLTGLFNEDRKLLRNMVQESEELFAAAHERKHEVLPTLLKLQENYVETGHYYVLMVDYMNEVAKALVHITRPSYEHINNNHEGLSIEQVDDLLKINKQVNEIYSKINSMLNSNDFSELDLTFQMRDALFGHLDAAVKAQIKRVKTKTTTTRSSLLFLTIINETKTMLLQSRNLLKSQKDFTLQLDPND